MALAVAQRANAQVQIQQNQSSDINGHKSSIMTNTNYYETPEVWPRLNTTIKLQKDYVITYTYDNWLFDTLQR